MQAIWLEELWNQHSIKHVGEICPFKEDCQGSFLDTCVFAYNTSHYESTYFTPFELMFNHQTTLPIDNELQKVLLEVSREYYNVEESRGKELDDLKKQSKIFSRFNRGERKLMTWNMLNLSAGQLVLKKDFTRKKKKKEGKLDIRFLRPYTISI